VQTQVMKYVTEEKVEPVQVQVMKYVTEERTMQVPRVVEKKTPYTYTVRMPRTVVTKVPLDPCGNPIPAAAAPAAASRPTSAPAPALSAADSGPLKTYSDRPADAPKKTEEGWGASSLDHVDPATGSAPMSGTVRAEKPTIDAPAAERSLKKIESIPAPAAKEPAVAPQPAPQTTPEQSPTIAPPGPAVYPPPPASDPRDVPAAETSGRSLTGRHGHTT
jgi:hypothetical protein